MNTIEVIPPASRAKARDSAEAAGSAAQVDIDVFVPLPVAAREFGKNKRTLVRWADQRTLGFPRAIRINGTP